VNRQKIHTSGCFGTKGHVIQRIRNPKIAVVCYVQPKSCLMILQISLYNTDRQEISGQYLHNESVPGDAVLRRHNKSKMTDGRNFEDRKITMIISVNKYLAIANRSRVSCAQHAEGIYKHKYYTVTLKSRLRVTQGHWKRNHWTDHTRLSSSRVI